MSRFQFWPAVGSNGGVYPLTERGKFGIDEVRYFPFAERIGLPQNDWETDLGAIAKAQDELEKDCDLSEAAALCVHTQGCLVRMINVPVAIESQWEKIISVEAGQQIPFHLDDVQYRWQAFTPNPELFVPDNRREALLVARKRDTIARDLEPFTQRRSRVRSLVPSSLALANYVWASGLVEDGTSPRHLIALDLGADNLTCLITNGLTLWVRDIPIGNWHFTRCIAKEESLTVKSAEDWKLHLATTDPESLARLVQPVIGDLVAEV